MDLFCEVLFINLPNLKTVNNNSESQQILIKSMEKSSEVVAAADLPSSDWIFKVVWKCLWKIAGLMEDLFLSDSLSFASLTCLSIPILIYHYMLLLLLYQFMFFIFFKHFWPLSFHCKSPIRRSIFSF